MKRQQWILLLVALALMAGTAGLLARVGSHQKLSPPAVKTRPSSDPKRLVVELPESVLNYTSKWMEPDDLALRSLPADTSFGERLYQAPGESFTAALSVVLMGTDRTSLHKPQFCLEGQGWRIDSSGSLEATVRVEGLGGYEMPIARLVASKEVEIDGRKQLMRGVYVYWFVADDGVNAELAGYRRMWNMGSKLLRTGVLQRWAYVSCFSLCNPGQEEAAFERIKRFIAAATPSFQLVPPPPATRQP
jgi:uncharacterized protein DUF3485